MKKIYLLLLLCSTITFGQSWKTISLSESIKFDLPEDYKVQDTANLRIFSAESPEASLLVSKTIEKTHVLSWDKIRILDLYTNFQKGVLDAHGGELVSDEVVEFQKIKAAKFIVNRYENGNSTTAYYLVFYYKGDLYTFELTTNPGEAAVGWNTKFYNEINIEGRKSVAVPESASSEVAGDANKAFSYILFVPFILIVVIAVILVLVLWKRHKEDKKSKSNML